MVRDLRKLEKDDVPIKFYNTWERVRSKKLKLMMTTRKYVSYILAARLESVNHYALNRYYASEDSMNSIGLKRDGDFWHGVSDEGGAAIYDDFRCSHMKPSEFINLIDYNRHYMNVKGGNVLNNYGLIIITSVENLDDIYANVPDEPRRQWVRRISQNIELQEPFEICCDHEL